MDKNIPVVNDVTGLELLQYSKNHTFPALVKTAALATLQELPLAITAYADPNNRQYPCDTKASTCLSALRFQEKQAEYNQVDRQVIRDRLDRYATFWQIDADVASMRQRASPSILHNRF